MRSPSPDWLPRSWGPSVPDSALVVLTRPDGENEVLAIALGREGIATRIAPCVRIAPLEDDAPLRDVLRRMREDDLLIVTSRAGARAIAAALGGARCAAPAAAVGERTAEACREAGLRVVFTPSVATGTALATEVPLPRGAVLLARSDRASEEPVAILRGRDAAVGEIAAYRTLPVAPDIDPSGEVVVFASPSAVDGFAQGGARAGSAVAIGPTTAARVRSRLGIEPRLASPGENAIVSAVQCALEERHVHVGR